MNSSINSRSKEFINVFLCHALVQDLMVSYPGKCEDGSSDDFLCWGEMKEEAFLFNLPLEQLCRTSHTLLVWLQDECLPFTGILLLMASYCHVLDKSHHWDSPQKVVLLTVLPDPSGCVGLELETHPKYVRLCSFCWSYAHNKWSQLNILETAYTSKYKVYKVLKPHKIKK